MFGLRKCLLEDEGTRCAYIRLERLQVPLRRGEYCWGKLNLFVREQARKVAFGIGVYAGHLISDSPHECIPKDKITFYMTKGNKRPKRSFEKDVRKRHQILEIYSIDQKHQTDVFSNSS